MKNILTYNEFINEDYRDVVGCGSGGIHADDRQQPIIASGKYSSGSITSISSIGDWNGDKKVLGTEEIKDVKSDYFNQRRRRKKKETPIEEEKKKRMRRKVYKNLLALDKAVEEDKDNNITTKFADFKEDKIKKFDKTKEFDPLSDDIMVFQELEDGEIEKVKEPVKILQVTGIITDPEKIKKLESVSGGPVFSTELKVKSVKRGDIIWLTALLERPHATTSWNAQTMGVIKARVVDYYYGLNKLKYV